jgi:hypothetical protein
MADVFDSRLQSSHKNLAGVSLTKWTCRRNGSSSGLDGFRKAIDCLGDPTASSSWPRRRLFVRSTWNTRSNKGRNVFMEKSFAVDAPGIRRVMAAGEEATKKNLKIAGGLMSRHYQAAGRGGRADPRRDHRRSHHGLGLSGARAGRIQAARGRDQRVGSPDPEL